MGRSYPRLTRRFGCRTIYVLCATVCLIVTGGAHAAEVTPTKRVLILSTGSRLSPGFTLMDRAILKALGNNLSNPVDTYAENLDILRFPRDRFQRIFAGYLTEKYAEQPPDLIVLVFVGSLAVAGKLLYEVFPGTPVVVAGATEEDVRADQFRNPVIGVASRVKPRATLELILRLQPETRRVVVVGGTAEVDRQVLDRVKEAARSFEGRVRFDFWDNRSMAELRRGVATLPSQTVILFSRTFRDGSGQAVISTQVGQSIAQWANVPVYVMTDIALGTGAVGGLVSNIGAIGNRAGEMARLILNGTLPASLPLETDTGNVPTFDWRALKRWGISEGRLPPNSVVRFRPKSLWEQYRWYILAALIIICLQGAMIVNLLLQRKSRLRIQTELRDSQQLMELATSAGELGLWSRELTNGGLWLNGPMRSLFGFGAHDAVRYEDLLRRVHRDDRDLMLSKVERAQTAGLPFDGELRILLPNGTERWVIAKGRTVGEPRGCDRRMGVVLDITERKRAEEKFRLALEASPNAIVMVDQQGKIQLINAWTEKLFGYSREELIGQSAEILAPERFRNGDPIHQAAFFGVSQARPMGAGQDLFARRKDGSEFLVDIGLNPIHTPEGTLVLTAIVDITERKRAELELQRNREELAHLTRVTTVGELTASVAHELNQPLGAILSNAEAAEMFLMTEPPALDEVRDILSDIRKDDQRAGEVIRRIRSLLRKQELTPKPMEVNDAIEEVIRLLSMNAAERKVALKFERTSGLPSIWYDAIHFQQVMMNLVLNAIEAMAPLPQKQRQIVIRTGAADNGSVKIAVADSGPGIPVDRLPKLFEPFFTTKKDGMGMGLSITRTIVEAHQGRIWVENNAAAGATFYFTALIAKEPSA
jgi:PAS domain S-box-containing protein